MKAIVYIAVIAVGILTAALTASEKKPERDAGRSSEQKDSMFGSVGPIIGVSVAGTQGEYRAAPVFGLRIIGIYIWGVDFNGLNADEYILSGIIAPVFHLIPESDFVDPVLMFGAVYSFHHWESKPSRDLHINSAAAIRKGAIHDITFGTGLGLNFMFASRYAAGLGVWLNYDYEVKETRSTITPK